MGNTKHATFTKWYNEETEKTTYTVTLPDGQVFKEVPKDLGDYLHQQEMLNGKVIGE